VVEFSRDVFMAKRDNTIAKIAENSSVNNGDHLAFEDKVADLDRQMDELRRLSSIQGIDYSSEIRQLQQKQVAELKRSSPRGRPFRWRAIRRDRFCRTIWI